MENHEKMKIKVKTSKIRFFFIPTLLFTKEGRTKSLENEFAAICIIQILYHQLAFYQLTAFFIFKDDRSLR